MWQFVEHNHSDYVDVLIQNQVQMNLLKDDDRVVSIPNEHDEAKNKYQIKLIEKIKFSNLFIQGIKFFITSPDFPFSSITIN